MTGLFNLEYGGLSLSILMKLYIMIEDDLIYMLKVVMYENSQKQGSYRREKSVESCLKKNRHMNA